MNAQMQLMAKTSPESSFTQGHARQIQRKQSLKNETDEDCPKCQGLLNLQRSSTKMAGPSSVPPVVHEVLNSPGQPLDTGTRDFMEPRFGHDFSKVRVHADSKAAESARAVNALAYAVGQNIVFGEGQYRPGVNDGKRLLAHELTHTLQQKDSISNTPEQMAVSSPESAAEQEAWAVSSAIMQGLPSQPALKSGIHVSPADAGIPTSTPAKGALALPSTRQSPSFTIVRQGGIGNTFVSTDSIAFTTQITGSFVNNLGGSLVAWAVQSVRPNKGGGNPTFGWGPNFEFTPTPINRPTTGSKVPNDPIRYLIEAQFLGVTATYNLEQDETDIIRQEYIDVGPVVPPAREYFVAPAIAKFNKGNYTLIVDRGMNNALTTTQNQFQTLTEEAAAPSYPPVSVPAITVFSGYRNPRRNIDAGSEFPVTSKHVWGRALDLGVDGANAILWTRLSDAGSSAGTSICEHKAEKKPCDDPTVDHVHIQWPEVL